tara:strand:+ start:1586 stop:1927 length:342 start_codon:yes stop_codon:yes gene_type:complete
VKNIFFDKEELVYILDGLSEKMTMYYCSNNWNIRTEKHKNVGLLMEKIKNNEPKIEKISFDKKELDFILGGLYSQQQSYGGGYFPHEDKVMYKHFKNVRSIIEKVEVEQKKGE